MKQRFQSALIAVVVVLFLVAVQNLPWILKQTESGMQPPVGRQDGWEVLNGWRVKEDRNNDGDSFKLQRGNQVMEFRLYFVDAPEKRRHEHNGDRIGYQGRYFGGLNEEQVLEIGKRARDYTLALLNNHDFSIWTRWQPVFESSRMFAMVQFAEGDFLSERLVQEGLVRIYTEGVDLPDGRSRAEFEKHLRKLEQAAKRARRGGWGRQP